MANTNLIKNNHKLDLIKYRYLFLGITGILLIPCIIAIIYLMVTQQNHAPLKLGIDFTGGTILQYTTDKKIDTKDISKIRVNLEKNGIKNPVIQTTTQAQSDSKIKNLISIRTMFLSDKENSKKFEEITKTLSSEYGGVQLVQVNSVGPTLGSELLKNTILSVT